MQQRTSSLHGWMFAVDPEPIFSLPPNIIQLGGIVR
jgi:hypothetical protein